MQISITGQNISITPALRQYIEKKFERIGRHFEYVINVHVILSVEKQRNRAEASLQVKKNKIFADDVQEDMYVAIDNLLDKLDRQIVRHKEKLKDHHQSEAIHHGSS